MIVKRGDQVGIEITISLFDVTYEFAEDLFNHLTDGVCEFAGGHTKGEDCPVQFVNGLKAIYAEEDEEE